MKVTELRVLLQKADRNQLESIAAEIYKKLPNSKKQELDEVINGILRGEKPAARKKEDNPSFSELEKEIRAFLSNADAGNYIEPNRVIPKQARSKWRFEVMRFLKVLDTVPTEQAAELYLEIYKRLAYGCAYYIFPSDDPFASIRSSQGDYYLKLINKYFYNGFSDEKILEMLRAATSVYLDRETLYCELEAAFISGLKTRDMREKAFHIAKEEVARLESIEPKRYSHEEYHIDSCISEICETILCLGIVIYEEDDALNYYMEHSREKNDEVKLYIALDNISRTSKSKGLWIKTYDNAVREGIKPRDSLTEKRKMLEDEA